MPSNRRSRELLMVPPQSLHKGNHVERQHRAEHGRPCVVGAALKVSDRPHVDADELISGEHLVIGKALSRDGPTDRSLVARDEMGRIDQRVQAKLSEKHPAQILVRIPDMSHLPVKDRANPCFVHQKVPDTIVSVHDCRSRLLGLVS